MTVGVDMDLLRAQTFTLWVSATWSSDLGDYVEKLLCSMIFQSGNRFCFKLDCNMELVKFDTISHNTVVLYKSLFENKPNLLRGDLING